MAFTFNDRGTEERQLLLKKRLVQEVEGDTKVVKKVDLLDSSKEFITEVSKEFDKEGKEIKDNEALPLFRFEDKYKPLCITYLTNFITKLREIRMNNQEEFSVLQPYLKTVDPVDIKHFIDLTILRNKTEINDTKKAIEIEIVTCYYEKKLRVKYKIPEEIIADKTDYKEYETEKNNIYTKFSDLFEKVKDELQAQVSPETLLKIVDSTGPDDYGVGYSIQFSFIKKIDYMNTRRESPGLEHFLDELTDSEKQHFNINKFVKSQEDDESGEGETSEEGEMLEDMQDAGEEGEEMSEDGEEMSEDDGMGDFGSDDGGGGDESGGDEYGDSDDGGGYGDDNEDKKTPGEHPFAEINGQNKAALETRELLNQINKVLTVTESLKINSVIVKKLIDLRDTVGDALKIAYIQPIEESLLRYSMYVRQFEKLVADLKDEALKNKRKNSKD